MIMSDPKLRPCAVVSKPRQGVLSFSEDCVSGCVMIGCT